MCFLKSAKTDSGRGESSSHGSGDGEALSAVSNTTVDLDHAGSLGSGQVAGRGRSILLPPGGRRGRSSTVLGAVAAGKALGAGNVTLPAVVGIGRLRGILALVGSGDRRAVGGVGLAEGAAVILPRAGDGVGRSNITLPVVGGGGGATTIRTRSRSRNRGGLAVAGIGVAVVVGVAAAVGVPAVAVVRSGRVAVVAGLDLVLLVHITLLSTASTAEASEASTVIIITARASKSSTVVVATETVGPLSLCALSGSDTLLATTLKTAVAAETTAVIIVVVIVIVATEAAAVAVSPGELAAVEDGSGRDHGLRGIGSDIALLVLGGDLAGLGFPLGSLRKGGRLGILPVVALLVLGRDLLGLGLSGMGGLLELSGNLASPSFSLPSLLEASGLDVLPCLPLAHLFSCQDAGRSQADLGDNGRKLPDMHGEGVFAVVAVSGCGYQGRECMSVCDVV
ncbi:hypothetical protein QBC44DRAFT_401535 [Cladorrhinum sp. PSN332]|nr:hypothetical protein QBC44DRAFT_401535 [Cladorrhinum sp. PSN332]